MIRNNYNEYCAPEVEVVATIVEQGFSASSNVEDPIEGEEQGW